MEVRRGLVYPHQTLLDDIQIDASAYAMVKVDMVYENSKNLKLEVPSDDMTLTLRDAITKRVPWRTSIDVDPSATTSVSATASQPNTTLASIFPNTTKPETNSAMSVPNSRAVVSVSNSRVVVPVSTLELETPLPALD
jgi:hypothetical protein